MLTKETLSKIRKREFDKYQNYHSNRITIDNYREYEYENKLDNLILDTLKDLEKLTNFARNIKLEVEYKGKFNISKNPYLERTDLIKYVFNIKVATKSPRTGEIISEETIKNYSLYVPRLIGNKKMFYINGNRYVPVLYMDDTYVRITETDIRIKLPLLFIRLDFVGGNLIFNNTSLPLWPALFLLFDAHNKPQNFKFIETLFEYFVTNILPKYKNIAESTIKKQISNFYQNVQKKIESEEFINSMKYIYVINYMFMSDDDLLIFSTKIDFGKLLRRVLNTYLSIRINKLALASEIPYEIVKKGIANVLYYVIKNYYLSGKIYELELHNNNNIRNRRIVFIEKLLRKFFYGINNFIFRVSREQELSTVTRFDSIIEPNCIVSDFLTNGVYYYDFPTPYFGIRAAQILNYGGSENLPTNSRLLHESQYNIICPIATSSQKPGVVLHSVPETPLDKHGHFVELFKPL